MSEPFYVTTAIAYPNGAPHVGHAYEYIATDAIARFKRLDGFDVRFLTGTDEHGLKMAQTAAAEGIATAELARRNSDAFQRLQEMLNISFDRFIRTTDPDHYAASTAIWQRMAERGDIYLDTYSGWYSVRDERFFTEAETRPSAPTAPGSPTETGTPVTWTEEQTYFFRLSAYTERLLAHYAEHPEFIAPEVRRNEVVSFVSGGLRDLSISRTSFDWGVPVPGDPAHVMYVWVDALTNYLTGAGYPGHLIGALPTVLAGRSAHDRQGHHPVPHRVLAGVPDVGGNPVAAPGLRARLSLQPRREDEQVGRQRRRPGGAGGRASGWTRCATSCCARCRSARTAATAKRHHRPDQHRPGQRVGQPGAAVAVDGEQEPRCSRCPSPASSAPRTPNCWTLADGLLPGCGRLRRARRCITGWKPSG